MPGSPTSPLVIQMMFIFSLRGRKWPTTRRQVRFTLSTIVVSLLTSTREPRHSTPVNSCPEWNL
jgi:hypothetical protein